MKRRHDFPYDGDYKESRGGGFRGRGRGRGRFDSYHGGRHEGRVDYNDGSMGDRGWRNNGHAEQGGQAYRKLPTEPIICQEVPIKSQLASGFIGTRGETVSRLRQQSRCRIHVRKSPKSNEIQVVEFRGTIEQVETGIQLMKEVIATLDPDFVLEISEQVACQVDIHPDMVGVIIGRGGSQVKQIRQRTGAFVRVEELQPGEGSQAVVILGTKESIKPAYDMVVDCLESFDPQKVRANNKGGPPLPRPNMPIFYDHEPAYIPAEEPSYEEPYPPKYDGGYQEIEDEARMMALPPPNALADQYPPTYSGGLAPAGDQYSAFNGSHFSQPAQPATPMLQNPALTLPSNPQPTLTAASNQFLTMQGLAGGAAPPQVLMLQPDGTYRPVQIVYQAAGQPAITQQSTQPAPIIIAAQPAPTLTAPSQLTAASMQMPAGSTQQSLEGSQLASSLALSMLAASQPMSMATLQPNMLQQAVMPAMSAQSAVSGMQSQQQPQQQQQQQQQLLMAAAQQQQQQQQQQLPITSQQLQQLPAQLQAAQFTPQQQASLQSMLMQLYPTLDSSTR